MFIMWDIYFNVAGKMENYEQEMNLNCYDSHNITCIPWLVCYRLIDLPSFTPFLKSENTHPYLSSKNNHHSLELFRNVQPSFPVIMAKRHRDYKLLCKTQPSIVAMAKLHFALPLFLF